MLKLASFLCVVALAAAKPGVLLAPTAYSTVVSPGFSSISQSSSSVVHPSPYPYALTYPYATYPHLLKKRSAPLLTYSYPIASYYAPSVYRPVLPTLPIATPLATPFAAPIAYSHLIKKRSAALIAPLAVPAATSYQSRIDIKNQAPIVSTTYAASPIAYASPYYGYGYAGYPYLY